MVGAKNSLAETTPESGLRLQLREQNHVADAFLAQQHHAESVNTHAHATSGWHAVFERNQKVFVELLLFAAGLVFEAFALFDRIVLLGIGRRDFLAVYAALENFHGRRVVRRNFGQRDELLRQMRNESGLTQRRLDQLFKDSAGDFKI